jgi:hypothetical protein
MPVPAASSFSALSVVLMSTRPGSTPAAMDDVFDGLPEAEEFDPPDDDDDPDVVAVVVLPPKGNVPARGTVRLATGAGLGLRTT